MTLIAFSCWTAVDTHGFRGVMVTGSLLFTIGFVVTASMISSTPSPIVMIPAVVAAGIGMATVLGNTTAAERRILTPIWSEQVLQFFKRLTVSAGH